MDKYFLKTLFVSFLMIGAFIQTGWSQQPHQKTKSTVNDQTFRGFLFYDPAGDSIISSYNAKKYFTPASNIKILTLHTALRYLGKYAPSLEYTETNGQLIFRGTGNPAFLHPELKDSLTWRFLTSRDKPLYYFPRPYAGNHYGPGWAWEDFKYYYAAEKASFPIYGNLVKFKFPGNLKFPRVSPPFFESRLDIFPENFHSGKPVTRALDSNYYYYKKQQDSLKRDLPFRYSTDLFLQLLQDTLQKKIKITHKFPGENSNIIYSTPMDSIYKEMMHESDNFLAEQIIMMYSSQNGDSLHTEKMIEKANRKLFADYPDSLKWVDGSGLSRYNLLTPRTIVKSLKQIEAMKSDEWLFNIFPVAGEKSMEDYPASDPPFIFAKTGSMGGIHCLSGYLLTLSGKKVIFSYMVNNFVADIKDIRKMIYRKLMEIREQY